MKFIDDFLDKNGENIKICLDVACGSGRFSIPISQYGIDVAALDIDLIPLRKLNGKSEGIMVARGDANCLPFKNSSFDCIFQLKQLLS
jgi:ubiquinone/menaquinone biosynthesis C-methylase UbiE